MECINCVAVRLWQAFNLFCHLPRCSSVADEVCGGHGVSQMLTFSMYCHNAQCVALGIAQSRSCGQSLPHLALEELHPFSGLPRWSPLSRHCPY